MRQETDEYTGRSILFYDGEREDPDFIFAGGRAYVRRWCQGEVRTVEKYPYAYDFFVQSGPHEMFDKASGCYSDRLRQWSEENWKRGWAEIGVADGDVGGMHSWTTRDASRFLSGYYRQQIECKQILQGCNVSNGYPLWYFVFEEEQA